MGKLYSLHDIEHLSCARDVQDEEAEMDESDCYLSYPTFYTLLSSAYVNVRLVLASRLRTPSSCSCALPNSAQHVCDCPFFCMPSFIPKGCRNRGDRFAQRQEQQLPGI